MAELGYEQTLPDSPAMRRHAPPERMIGADPGAGNNFTQAVNDGYLWRLSTVMFRLNTSAAAANRTVRIEYRGADGIPWIICGNPVTYPASTTNEDFCFTIWQPLGAWEVGTANLGPLAPALLRPTDDFRITVVNIDAGDTITRIRYTVERFEIPPSSIYPYG